MLQFMENGSIHKRSCGWVLLRGWTREQRHWNDFPNCLAQKSREMNESIASAVICLDLPGTGTEISYSSPTTIENITDDLKSRLDRVKPSPSSPIGVIGISMGGMIALDWGTRFPGDFSKIVLINSSLGSLSRPWHRLNLSLLPQMLPILFMRDEEKIEKAILNLTSSLTPKQQTEIAKKFTQIRQSSKVSKTTLLRQLIAAGRFSLSSLPKIPTLIITSENDRLVDPRCSKELAVALQTNLVIHPTAGHDIPLDDPEWLAEKIAEWSTEIDLD